MTCITTCSRGRCKLQIGPYLRILRPTHWTKNLVVFTALFSSNNLSNLENLKKITLLFLAFCTASSINYVTNDWLDKENDALHKSKKERPFAAGLLGLKSFIALLATLSILQSFLFLFLNSKGILYVVLYLLSTFSYSFYFKKVVVVEMIIISFGFILRALAGAVVVDVEVTIWFLIVICFGSLFLISNKRLSEKRFENVYLTRKTLTNYSILSLKIISDGSMFLAWAGFLLWVFQVPKETLLFAKNSFVIFSIALLRYRWISTKENVEKPEIILFSDKILLITGVILVILISLAV